MKTVIIALLATVAFATYANAQCQTIKNATQVVNFYEDNFKIYLFKTKNADYKVIKQDQLTCKKSIAKVMNEDQLFETYGIADELGDGEE